MRWPWVGIGRMDDLREQYNGRIEELKDINNWLRQRNNELTENFIRLQRFREGLTETPRKERTPIGKMPHDLRKYTENWANPSTGKEMRRSFYRRVAQGETWDSIMSEVLGPQIKPGEIQDE